MFLSLQIALKPLNNGHIGTAEFVHYSEIKIYKQYLCRGLKRFSLSEAFVMEVLLYFYMEFLIHMNLVDITVRYAYYKTCVSVYPYYYYSAIIRIVTYLQSFG